MSIKQKNSKGFTIIEVVLVLAIAGLIFLMVFIALPALQRSQRDTARKSDVGIVLSAVSSFESNNKGAFIDGTALDQISPYVTTLSVNSTLTAVTSMATGDRGSWIWHPGLGAITVVPTSLCGTTTIVGGVAKLSLAYSSTPGQFSVITGLEAGGTVVPYCQNN